jgi:T5SS/PEP-CTERM-associated repeat protein
MADYVLSSGQTDTISSSVAVDGVYDDGTSTIVNGGSLQSTSASLGTVAGAAGTLAINAGGSWTNSDYVDIGYDGSGTVSVTGGGTLSTNNVSLGVNANAQGTLIVDGSGSTWTNTSFVNIGSPGDSRADVTISNSAKATIGSQATDYLYVDAGSGLSPSGAHPAPSTLTVTTSASLETTGLNIARGNVTINQQATLTLDGANPTNDAVGPHALYDNFIMTVDNAKVTANGAIIVGDGNAAGAVANKTSGILTVDDGATVTDTWFSLGYDDGDTGRVVIEGQGTTWTDGGSPGSTLRDGTVHIGDSGTGNLTITDHAVMTESSYAVLGSYNTAEGTVFVTDSGTWNIAAALYVGALGQGYLTVNSNATITADSMDIAAAVYNDPNGGTTNSRGTATISDQGTTVTIAHQLTVGDQGDGDMTIESGATVTADTLAVAVAPSTGSDLVATNLTITGDGSTLTIDNEAQIGVSGTGSVDIEQGGQLSTGAATIGVIEDGATDGLVTVDSMGTWIVTDDLTIGGAGTGELDINGENGTGGTVNVQGDNLVIGADETGIGTLALDGQGATLTFGGDMVVGKEGTGTFSISDSAQYVADGDITAGSEDGGEGTIEIDGDNSTLQATNGLTLGDSGTGNLTIENGGSLIVEGDVEEGVAESGDGTDEIGDAGVTADLHGDWTIGVAGTHDDTIDGGIQVNVDGDLTLGEDATGDGTLTVTDEDTTLTTGGDVKVGGQGTGTFNIEDQALVDASASEVTAGDEETGDGTIDIEGGAELDANALTIGGSGTGDVTVDSDSTITVSNDITIGDQDDSDGTFEADGTVTTSGLTVGSGGDGTMVVTGDVTASGDTTLGEEDSGTGTLNVTGGTLELDGSTTIGDQGSGTLSTSVGASVTAQDVTLGDQGSSSGELDVDGDGTTVQVGKLTVGSDGSGTVSVTNFGELIATDDVTVADKLNANLDQVTVDTQASLDLLKGLTVGGSGIGTLAVTNGASTTVNGDIVVGDNEGSGGTLTIQGTNVDPVSSAVTPSSLTYAGKLTIGNHGYGVLNIFDGAQVTPTSGGAAALEIASNSDATGQVYVGDSGTLLQATTVAIGGTDSAAGGSGQLTVENNGSAAFGTVTIWSTGTLMMSLGRVTASSYDVKAGGAITGFGSVIGAVDSDGTIAAVGGTLSLSDNVSGSGLLTVGDASTLDVEGVSQSSDVDFTAGTKEILGIGNHTNFLATVTDFKSGDTINIEDIGFQTGDVAHLAAGNDLQIMTSTGTVLDSLQLDQSDNFAGWTFNVSRDGSGLDVTGQPCYCPGTLIATERGDIPVELLAIGDRVLTSSGQFRAIKWIGKRIYDGRFIASRKEILPVCIMAGAIAANVPARDLWISPHHAMFLDGVLIEARDLINGMSIVQARHVERVEYFHIELDTHDVILAEGAWSETFLGDDSRNMFHNAHEYAALYPEAGPEITRYFAPRLEHGFEAEAIRQKIARRAGFDASLFYRGAVPA